MYIYIYMCVCMCVHPLESQGSFRSVSLWLSFSSSRGPGLPTKTARQGGENVPAIVKLLIGCCGPLVCFVVVHVPDVVPGGV